MAKAKRIETDVIDADARAKALAAAQDTFWPPITDTTVSWTDSYEKYGIVPMGATKRPALAGEWTNGGHNAVAVLSFPADSVDGPIRQEVKHREWNPKRPGDGERESLRLEKRLRKLIRRLDGGASTYEASIRRLALLGRLSKRPKSCPECNGTGFDPEFLNLGEVQCAACIGTGHAAIVAHKQPLRGYLDPYRFRRDEAGNLIDREAERSEKLRDKASRKVKRDHSARCARRVHKWNEDQKQRWCTVCGKVSLKYRIVPA